MYKKLLLLPAWLLLLAGCAPLPESSSASPALPQSVQQTAAMRETEQPDTEAEFTLPAATAAGAVVQETLMKDEPDMDDWLYRIMYEAFSQQQLTVHFEAAVDSEDVEAAYHRLHSEHPELFWLTGYKITIWENAAEMDCKVINGYSAQQISSMQHTMETTAQNIANLAKRFSTRYEQILFVHDYLIQNTDYDQAGASSDAHGLWNCAYGCLMEHRAVCQGYAEAFQLIMQKLDIPCGVCSGMARNERHAWNYVQIDGVYYWIDVTWDDPVGNNGGELWHSYFLINDDMLYRTHVFGADNIFVPTCNSLNLNYYVQNQNYLTAYSFAEIDSRITAHQYDGEVELMFTTSEAFQMALNNLFDNGNIWNVSVFNGGGKVNYACNEEMYVIQLHFQPTA